ncbi:MAG TPA: hypothetical protein VGP63_04390 [Planctomycetaceae bacterium]|jgi:hypothetical protein|nr:hypothetical protein [Planctomycetaceae bacterium]
MKFNSPKLIGQLCAASAVALASAILIVGCATGERTGRFWNKGDVASSDAYVAAEMARDQSMTGNTTPGANGKIATVSGTKDEPGRVALPDFPDLPPAPPSPPSVTTSTSAAGGAAAASAQTAAVVAGGAQSAGSVGSGSIVAPYVQKRAPNGAVDNNLHDSEIVRPKPVFGKQIDPFAETDALPYFASPSAKRPTPPATAHAPIASANPFAGLDGAAPPLVSTKVAATPAPTQPASSPPSAVDTPAARADAFDPSAPPPSSISATSALAEPLPTASQPAPASQPVPASTSAAAPVASGFELLQPAPVAHPTRRHVGVRLGDENLDDDQPSSPAVEKHVQPAATQVTAEVNAPVATSPYESDHAPTACVTAPPAPVSRPANAAGPAQPSPAQDSWESTKVSKPAGAPSEHSAPAPAPARETARVVAPMELAPQRQAPKMPDAMESAPIQASAAPISDAPIKAPIEATADQDRAVVARVERHRTSADCDPMICDSARVHGKYTGGGAAARLVDAPPIPHEAVPQKMTEVAHPAGTAKLAAPAAKKVGASNLGKATSYWDDPFASPLPTQRVSTADFSVPAPPGPFDVDDAHSTGLKAGSACDTSIAACPARASGRSRSRAWFVIGMLGGIVVSAVVWRRLHHHGEAT